MAGSTREARVRMFVVASRRNDVVRVSASLMNALDGRPTLT